MKHIYYVTQNTPVIARSILDHKRTHDSNAEGFLLNNGTDRELCSAITMSGQLVFFAKTNGDPVLLHEDNVLPFIRSVSDCRGGVIHLETGIEALQIAADMVASEDSEAAAWLENLSLIGDFSDYTVTLKTDISYYGDSTEDEVLTYVDRLESALIAEYPGISVDQDPTIGGSTKVTGPDDDLCGDIKERLEVLFGLLV